MMRIDLRIARHGAVVLLLGMLTGFMIGRFHNHNTGNAAHLTGLIGGYGLIALGLLWPHLKLRPAWSITGVWITVVSMYLNWLGLVVHGLFGSAGATGGVSGANWRIISDRAGGVILTLAVILSLMSVVIVLIGLRSHRRLE